MDNFDLKKYLVENKVTTNSQMMNEEATMPKDKIEAYIEQYSWDDTAERQDRSASSYPGFGKAKAEMEKQFPGIKMAAYNYCKMYNGTDGKIKFACKESILSPVNARDFEA